MQTQEHTTTATLKYQFSMFSFKPKLVSLSFVGDMAEELTNIWLDRSRSRSDRVILAITDLRDVLKETDIQDPGSRSDIEAAISWLEQYQKRIPFLSYKQAMRLLSESGFKIDSKTNILNRSGFGWVCCKLFKRQLCI